MLLACTSESYNVAIKDGRLTLEGWMELCARDLGLAAVEIEDKHLTPDPATLRALRKLAADLQLPIVNIALFNNFGWTGEGRRREEVARTKDWIRIAKELGCLTCRSFAGWPEGGDPGLWRAMVAALGECAAYAEELGVVLIIENHNHDGFIKRADDVLRLVADVGSEWLALLLDSGNYLDGLRSVERTAHLARHVHAKLMDVDGEGADREVDHRAVLAVLRQAGYRGYVSVEYEGKEDCSTAVPRAVRWLQRALREVNG